MGLGNMDWVDRQPPSRPLRSVAELRVLQHLPLRWRRSRPPFRRVNLLEFNSHRLHVCHICLHWPPQTTPM